MELKARTVVEGFLAGLHRSPYKGFSVEFAEYRQYLPGDDLSTLDWKVFARSDRYYVKKFEEETNLECHLLLDISASMAYRGAAAMSKLEYGSVLAASLAYPDEPPARRDRPDRVRSTDHRPSSGERHPRSSARDPADAREAGARQPVRRQPAAAPARRGARQAQPGRADFRSARRARRGRPRPEAPAVQGDGCDRAAAPRSARAPVSVPHGRALHGRRERGGGHRGSTAGARRISRVAGGPAGDATSASCAAPASTS